MYGIQFPFFAGTLYLLDIARGHLDIRKTGIQFPFFFVFVGTLYLLDNWHIASVPQSHPFLWLVQGIFNSENMFQKSYLHLHTAH